MSYKGRGRGRGTFFRNNMANSSNSKNSPNSSVMAKPEKKGQPISHDSFCCKGIRISLNLDYTSMLFFDELNQMWSLLKKSQPVVVKIHQFFDICTNPYEQTLRLLYNCKDFNFAKAKSLPFFIIEEFKAWSSSNFNKISHLLSVNLKIDAFKLISKQNVMSLTRLVVETYKMADDADKFLDIIKCLIEKKKYKDAGQYCILFKLQAHFTAEDIALPLILQDKLFVVDEFLNSSPRHQVELVGLLDGALGQPSSRDALASYALNLDVPDVKWDKLYGKPLKKLIARLVKTYKLLPDLTPNFNKKRNEGALQFLIHKRYTEASFGDESFKEMAQEAVGDDIDLQKELVVQMCQHGDVSGALRFAHFYKIDKEDWPYNVRMLEENGDEERLYQRNVLSEENWDSGQEQVEYLQLELPYDAISLIDSVELFSIFLQTEFQNVDVVGVDCEWKPSFGIKKNELALMQIASRRKLFILDVISIGSQVPDLWQKLGNFLFNNCDILKLGFGFTSDMAVIKSSLPGLNFTPKQIGFLDLNSLWQVLEKNFKITFPYEVQNSGSSLSTLVNQCLGRPLDKSDQFSNWEKRPLRQSQLIYAALDAYCLIQVYDVLRKLCEKLKYPFDDICYNLMTNDKAIKKKPKKTVKTNQKIEENIPQPESPHTSEIPPNKVKVVCDTMLQGLGKLLRKCGIDTTILDNNMDHMECVRFAQDEERYIVTRGAIFNKLYGYVPQGHCLKILSDNIDEQLKEFLDYYKVVLTEDDVFNVCQACNGGSFVKVSRSTMWALKNRSVVNMRPDFDLDYDYLDEATGFSSDEDVDFNEAGGNAVNTTKWDMYSDEKIDVGLCKTKLGIHIQVDGVPKNILEKKEFFYVCEHCGKIYWEGSHRDRILTGRLKGLVQVQ